MLRRPARILNESSVFLGLNFNDLIGLAILLMAFQLLLRPFQLEVAALVLTGVALVILSGVRLKHRRKIIRDSLSRRLAMFLELLS